VTMQRTPDFDDLVGLDVPAGERERLHRVHELLVQADAPAELSPELERIPWPEEALQPLGLMRRPRAERPRRPRLVYFAAAATLVAVGFLIGQATTSKDTSIDAARTVRMHGVGSASTAAAVIDVGRGNDEGNWPMLISVRGLPPAPKGTYYSLWLSAHGKPKFLCGTFNTKAGATATVIRMSAAYPLQEGGFDGWIVTLRKPGQRATQSQLMMTT
jgi:Anti-sigma-K factor rskA